MLVVKLPYSLATSTLYYSVAFFPAFREAIIYLMALIDAAVVVTYIQLGDWLVVILQYILKMVSSRGEGVVPAAVSRDQLF